jgi:hypothetical protein
VKLDLACGTRPADGFVGVDLYAPGVERVDLLKFPWPYDDNSVEEVRCSHFIEHIPARDVEDRDLGDLVFNAQDFIGRDMLCAFMNEVYRILVPGGRITIIVPYARSNVAFQDPTHRRFIIEDTFNYFDREKRARMHVEHYGATCDFVIDKERTKMLAASDAQLADTDAHWNVLHEIHCTMVKRVS